MIGTALAKRLIRLSTVTVSVTRLRTFSTSPYRHCGRSRSEIEVQSGPHHVELTKIMPPARKASNVIGESDGLRLETGDSGVHRYPWVYLRDCCLCPQCFLPSSRSRMGLIKHLDTTPDIKASRVDLVQDAEAVRISWPDGHLSLFPVAFLLARSFSAEAQKARREIFKMNPVTWDSEHVPHAMDYDCVKNSDEGQLEFLQRLETSGLVILKNGPQRGGSIEELANSIAHIRVTNYG